MEQIKIAYLLVVHKNPKLVNEFINQLLLYGDCDIFIHIDKKNTSIADEIIKNNHVYICSEYDVRWGSFEIVKAAIKLMEMASKNEYTHFYFGSGQDLLVKKGLYNYLEEHPNKIFLRINREITNNNRASARYRVRWPDKLMIRDDVHFYRFVRIGIQILCKLGIVIRRNKTKLKNAVKFYEGRTWFIAPFDILLYILNYISKNPDYLLFWKDSLASDLMFFQTILMNSSYKENIEDELMYVNFGKKFSTMNHPLDITIEDDVNIEIGNYFCARKFDSDNEVIKYYLDKTKS